MNRINAVVKMYFTDRFSWFYLPWIIILSSFVVNFIVSLFVSEPIFTGGISSIYIYALILGILVLVQNFPFALGFSIRRKDFFIGTVVAICISSVIIGVILYLLAFIEKSVIVGWGTELNFFYLPYVSDNPIMQQIIINIGLLLHLFFTGYVMTSLSRRFGIIGMFSIFIIIGLLFSVGGLIVTKMELWRDIGQWFVNHTAFDIILWSIPLTIIYILISYILHRRATV